MSQRTSKRYTSQCITPPPVDAPVNPNSCGPSTVNCNDPVYAAAHPDECNGGGTGDVLTLVLKPSVASILIGNTLQYATVVVVNGIENSVTAAVTYTSSNPSVASINASTGQATGVANGVVTITATWHGLMAFAQLTVVTVCINEATDYCIVLDTSASMGLPFNASYSTKLAFAIAAARLFAAGVDFTRDMVSLAYFNETGLRTVTRARNLVDVNEGLDAIHQSESLTSIYEAVVVATNLLSEASTDRKVALFFTDGEDRPTPDEAGNSIPNALVQLRALGTIVEVCGVRAYGSGYALLNTIASGGFFLNAYGATAAATLTALSAFVSYGTCSDYSLNTPPPAQSPDTSPLQDIEGDGDGGGGGGGGGGFSHTSSFTAQCTGTDVGEPVTRTATYVSQISPADAQVHADAAARQAAYAALSCCSNSVVIGDFTAATPYPSCYRVAGFTGTVTSIGVVIQNLTHPSPADLSMVLVGPQGQAVVLVASCGVSSFPTRYPIANLTMTFAAGGAAVPTGSTWGTATYAPTKCISAGVGVPGMPDVTNTSLSVFNGKDPNGGWSLYIKDHVGLDAGSIDSWFIVVNGQAGCAVTPPAGNVRIHDYVTVAPTIGACSSCTAISGGATWDGVFVKTTLSPTLLYSSVNGPDNGAINFNNRRFHVAYIRYVNFTGGVCFWELVIQCLNTTATVGQNPDFVIWTGRKSAAFGAGPVGSYDRVSTTVGVGTPAPCSVTPAVIQIENVP